MMRPRFPVRCAWRQRKGLPAGWPVHPSLVFLVCRDEYYDGNGLMLTIYSPLLPRPASVLASLTGPEEPMLSSPLPLDI